MSKVFFHNLDSSGSEVIFAPLHDPALASQLPLVFSPEAACGASIEFQWSWTLLAWNDCPPGEIACSVSCQVFQSVKGFDAFIACFSAPPEIFCRFSADFGKGHRPISEKIPGRSSRDEQVIPIPREGGKADFLHYFTIEIFCTTSGPNQMTLSWFGLRDGGRHNSMHGCRVIREPACWETFIEPPSRWDEPKFAKGLLFDERELSAVRQKIGRPGWKEHFAILTYWADQYRKRVPEADLGSFLPTRDERYVRSTERNKRPYHWEALVLAFVGLVNRDSGLIQHALRYLMCMASTPNWTESAEHRIPTSTWDTRCFLEEMTATSVAMLMDWLDFALKPATREWLRQVLWDRGIAYVQRNLMKFPYMHTMNQGAVFTRACILGGLMLEDHWDLDGLVDRCYLRLQHILNDHIRPDGSFHEGPAYFCQLLQGTIPSIVAYHRARDNQAKQAVRNYFGRCLPFIETLSAGVPGTMVPRGDSRTEWLCGDGVPVLASFFPDSCFAGILDACLRKGSVFSVTGTLSNSGGILGLVLGPEQVLSLRVNQKEFSHLPDCGVLACRRNAGSHVISLWIFGGGGQGTHAHQDYGSFVLEVDNVPIFVDPGMVEYNHIHSLAMSHSAMHNLLTPVRDDGAFPTQHPDVEDEPLSHCYDRPVLSVRMSLFRIWKKYFNNYQRQFISEKAEMLSIEDSGHRREPGGVAFHLHTPHEISSSDHRVAVLFPGGRCTIKADWADETKIDQKGVGIHHQPLNHIIFQSAVVSSFEFRTRIEVEFD